MERVTTDQADTLRFFVFLQAVEYFKRILSIQENNGEIWGALGHCYLMMDQLQEAYHAYQQALYHLPNPRVSVVYNTAFSLLTIKMPSS